MTKFPTSTAGGLTVSAILLCPIIVILLTPLTIGVGLNVFDEVGEVPFALILCTPLALSFYTCYRPDPGRTTWARQISNTGTPH